MAVSRATLERNAVAVDPKHYKVELENERVRVVRITYEAGASRSCINIRRAPAYSSPAA